ncbi:hypothetical protein KCF3NO3_37380 [Chryseobacterium sp. KCF3-3]
MKYQNVNNYKDAKILSTIKLNTAQLAENLILSEVEVFLHIKNKIKNIKPCASAIIQQKCHTEK